MNRRMFCLSMLALPSAISGARAQAPEPATWDHYRRIRFLLNEPLEHPFFWWPRTLLSYPIEFQQAVDLNRMVLTRTDNGERLPVQFTNVVKERGELRSATLNFFSDLPSGARREFVLSAAEAPIVERLEVHEANEGNTIVLDSGPLQVRIPASQSVHGEAPGPILQVARGAGWIGHSTLNLADGKITRITTTRVESGPLVIAYRVAYESEGGSRYVATVQLNAGQEFARLHEDMEAVRPGVHGGWTSNWTGFDPTHRQAPNHPVPVMDFALEYDKYPWETIGEPFPPHTANLPDGKLPFQLGIFQMWTAFHSSTSANFWNNHTGDSLGVFIDKTADWQDHQYASHEEAETLQVLYFYEGGKFRWEWPIARGSRSTCVAFYDHALDKKAMQDIEASARSVKQDGLKFDVGLAYISHTMFLQNRYGTIDLNCVKDWVLEYPANAKQPAALFTAGTVKDASDLETRVLTSQFVCSLPLIGARENAATGGIPGRGIVNFSPVPSRQVTGWWIDSFNRLRGTFTERQRRRLTAMYLLLAYVCAGEEFMPVVPMLSGHPNILNDPKSVPPCMAFLFPEHPMAHTWADFWQ